MKEKAWETFGTVPFTTAQLYAVLGQEDLPPKVRYAEANKGNPLIVMGWELRKSPDFERVAMHAHASLWAVTSAIVEA